MTTADKFSVLERTVEELCRQFATLITRGWMISPHALLLAQSRSTVATAIRLVHKHPDQRAAIVQQMKQIAAAVEAETSVKH